MAGVIPLVQCMTDRSTSLQVSDGKLVTVCRHLVRHCSCTGSRAVHVDEYPTRSSKYLYSETKDVCTTTVIP